MVNTLQCRFCDEELPQDARFCCYCGKSLTEKEKARSRKKRGNGQGCVYKHGNSYIAERTLGYYTDENGKTHRRTVKRSFERKKDAVEALPTLAELASPRGLKKRRPLLRELYDAWFDTLTVGRDTVNCYKAAWKYFSQLHDLYADEIDIDDLQTCIDECPHGKRTRQNMKTVAGLLYKYGIPRGIFPEKLNLAQYLKVTGEDGAGGTSLPDSYVAALFGAIGKVDAADLIVAQCYLGFRPGEFLALWKDSYNADLRTFTGGAKTEAGKNRIVTVSPKIQGIVDKYASIGDGQFFCNEDGSERSVKDYRNAFYAALDTLGLDNPVVKVGDSEKHTYTPHSCRHTFATLMKRVEGNVKDKQSLIGHSSSEMLRYYQDAPVEDLRKITDNL